MPSNILSIDSNFPTFTGEESPEQQIRTLHNYLFQLREGLQYSLRNLSTDNFNATALQGLTNAQKDAVSEELSRIMALLNQLSTKIDRVSGQIGIVTAEWAQALEERVQDLEEDPTVADTAAAVFGEGGLAQRADNAEAEIEALTEIAADHEERLMSAETAITGEGGLEQRTKVLEDAVTAEGGLQSRTVALEGAVAGEGGLGERITATEQSNTSLDERVKALEEDLTLAELEKTVIGEGGLEQRTKVLEDTVTAEGGLQSRTAALEEAVTAEGGLQSRTATLEETVTGEGGLGQRTTALEEAVTGEAGLQQKVAGEGGLEQRTKVLEDVVTAEGGLQSRTAALETAVTAEGGLQERVQKLEDDETVEQLQAAVAGEGGLQERMGAAEQNIQKITGAVRVAEDQTAIGEEGKPLHLVGKIYINGVLIGAEGET